MRSQKGQIILILIMVMIVALAIGLSVIQRSLVDVSSSTKVEESSRAFSAAEAGIERAIVANSSIGQVDLGNNSLIAGVQKIDQPQPREALEYPPFSKAEIAQVWLADPNSFTNPPAEFYNRQRLEVYWGDHGSDDKVALELILIYNDGKYQARRWYLDNSLASRNPDNNFDITATCSNKDSEPQRPDPNSIYEYQCYKQLGNGECRTRLGNCSDNDKLPPGLMLLRARLLYNDNSSHPFAANPVQGSSLPTQASIFISTGTSGNTQRKVRVFRLYKVLPSYFDYAIFSAAEINK